jgi:3-hydroxyacyl-[acyl-carrier-protein] dehydratase
MPGVLIMEALAQAAGILSFKSEDKKPTETDVFYFAGIDEARFKRPVMPGDQLHLHVQLERQMRGVWKFYGEAKVDGQLAASAKLMCAKRDL